MDDNPRLPVPRNPLLPVRRTVQPPALWQEAAPVVARGAALVAVGLIGEWLLRSVARSAFSPPRNGRSKARGNTALVRREDEQPPPGTITISETLIMTRKVIVRR
jgi:hypothetical protein